MAKTRFRGLDCEKTELPGAGSEEMRGKNINKG